MVKITEDMILDIEMEAKRIRKKLIETVSKNGGHLAPNLGVVELTLCLHKIFDFSKDKLLFDVGHQSYVHKILTGRDEEFSTLRKKNGIGPFMDPKESSYDPYISGHAGTALPAAVGIALANPDKKIIVVVGDASIANGHSLEAFNYIGGKKLKNIIVILNDNEMSIGKNVGILSDFFGKIMLSTKYKTLRKDVRSLVDKLNAKKTKETLERLEGSVKNFFIPLTILENFGFSFLGASNGHDVNEMLSVFNKANNTEGPILLYVKTEKGKGYKFAEENKERFHGISCFDINTGKTNSNGENYSAVFGEKMLEMMREDDSIYAISAGMIKGTGLDKILEEIPDRCLDTGIAEGFAVSAAGGLSISGKKAYICIYSTFLQRAFSQIIHDIVVQNLPVKFIVDRAGIVGEDGKTHNGIYDLPFFLSLPNVIIIEPTTKVELINSLEFSKIYNEGPLAIRMPRDTVFELENIEQKFELGKWNEIKTGNKNLFIACGSMLKEIKNVETKLKDKGIEGTIVSAAFIKPFDEAYLLDNIDKYENIFILEEAYMNNCFATSLIQFLNTKGIKKIIHSIGLYNSVLAHGSRNEILSDECLTGENLVRRIEEKIYGGKK